MKKLITKLSILIVLSIPSLSFAKLTGEISLESSLSQNRGFRTAISGVGYENCMKFLKNFNSVSQALAASVCGKYASIKTYNSKIFQANFEQLRQEEKLSMTYDSCVKFFMNFNARLSDVQTACGMLVSSNDSPSNGGLRSAELIDESYDTAEVAY